MKIIIIVAAGAFALAGCATRAENISAAYVSPIQYQNYTCAQLQEEAARVSARAAIANGAQDQKATGDAVATGVGVVLFWPALFFIKGDAGAGKTTLLQQTTRLQAARYLRGEREFGRPASDGHGDRRATGIGRAGG